VAVDVRAVGRRLVRHAMARMVLRGHARMVLMGRPGRGVVGLRGQVHARAAQIRLVRVGRRARVVAGHPDRVRAVRMDLHHVRLADQIRVPGRGLDRVRLRQGRTGGDRDRGGPRDARARSTDHRRVVASTGPGFHRDRGSRRPDFQGRVADLLAVLGRRQRGAIDSARPAAVSEHRARGAAPNRAGHRALRIGLPVLAVLRGVGPAWAVVAKLPVAVRPGRGRQMVDAGRATGDRASEDAGRRLARAVLPAAWVQAYPRVLVGGRARVVAADVPRADNPRVRSRVARRGPGVLLTETSLPKA
jgi:hypothetical protein